MTKTFFIKVPVGNDIQCTIQAIKLYFQTGKSVYRNTVKDCFDNLHWNLPHLNKKYNSYLNSFTKELLNPEHVIELRVEGNGTWYKITSYNSEKKVVVE